MLFPPFPRRNLSFPFGMSPIFYRGRGHVTLWGSLAKWAERHRQPPRRRRRGSPEHRSHWEPFFFTPCCSWNCLSWSKTRHNYIIYYYNIDLFHPFPSFPSGVSDSTALVSWGMRFSNCWQWSFYHLLWTKSIQQVCLLPAFFLLWLWSYYPLVN